MLDRVYKAVAWQRVDQIHYNIIDCDQIKYGQMGQTIRMFFILAVALIFEANEL
jgi:hypothetical protein